MITLTPNEQKKFDEIVTNVIPNLSTGKYMAKDFFGKEPVSPRIVRRIYEETVNGNIPRVSLIGKKSEEGYFIG